MNLTTQQIEKNIGIEVYATSISGIGGEIKRFPEDFIVEEVLINGSEASISSEESGKLISGHGRYVICFLIKKGWDTFLAIRAIAKQLRIPNEMLNIAGIKDKNALTAQHLSIATITPRKIFSLNFCDLKIIPIGFSSRKMSPKLLAKNKFRITVRSIDIETSKIENHIKRIKDELSIIGGVPNFFGHQRFGTVRPITHKIGRCLIKGDYKQAVDIFLCESSLYEHPNNRKARMQLKETHNYASCFNLFTQNLVYEKQMVRYLSKHPKDYLGAIRRLPIGIRVLSIQAFQSYLFNRFLSERMKQEMLLTKTHPGDFAVELQKNHLPTSKIRCTTITNEKKMNKDIQENRVALALPLIGYEQAFSGGEEGNIEKKVMSEEDIKYEEFKLKDMPRLSVRGSIRPALIFINQLKININKERMKSHNLTANFLFDLNKGSYATVVLREFMKPKNIIEAGF